MCNEKETISIFYLEIERKKNREILSRKDKSNFSI